MIGALVGAGLGLASSLFGGIKAAKQRKKQERMLAEEKAANKDLFEKEYYQDYMDRSDARAAMKRVKDTMRRNNDSIAKSASVSGSTPEAVAAQKAANNEAITQAASNIQSNAAAQKNIAKAQYLRQNENLSNQQLTQSALTERGMGNFADNALDVAGKVASAGIDEGKTSLPRDTSTYDAKRLMDKNIDELKKRMFGSVWDR